MHACGNWYCCFLTTPPTFPNIFENLGLGKWVFYLLYMATSCNLIYPSGYLEDYRYTNQAAVFLVFIKVVMGEVIFGELDVLGRLS